MPTSPKHVDYRLCSNNSEIIFNELLEMFFYWLVDYLSHRQQYVSIDNKRSKKLNVNFGVPQSSILGPLLFHFYVSDMKENIQDLVHGYNMQMIRPLTDTLNQKT